MDNLKSSLCSGRVSVLIFVLIQLLAFDLQAQIKLPKIIASNMVLQRNTDVKIWGWAKKNETVKLEASWLDQPITVKSNKSGKWLAELTTTNSKSPQILKISDKSSAVILDNILFGEVWLCSGQSNMSMHLNGYKGEPIEGSLQAIANSTNPNLRLFNIIRTGSKTLSDTLSKVQPWVSADPNTTYEFSALAYFYGSQLQEILDVPVGLIHSSWGGSKVEAWMSEDLINQFEEVDVKSIVLENPRRANQTPAMLFNSMINPITNYTIKGALWYQGESNRQNPEQYTQYLPAMVNDWRARWGLGDFPFYQVQIAPYRYGGLEAYSYPENTAFIREAQLETSSLIKNSEVVITTDLGALNSIHPPKKKEVADRLLYNALNKTYGFTNIDCKGPMFKSHQVKEDSLFIEFDFIEKGMYTPKGLANFEVAGEDKVFYPASATFYEKFKVLVKSESVPNPVAVRYGWSNFFEASLFDNNLLPASSFRSDNWQDATQADNP